MGSRINRLDRLSAFALVLSRLRTGGARARSSRPRTNLVWLAAGAWVALHTTAHAADTAKPLDEVVLRDGRHVRGRVVREEARWLVVETDDQHRRTFTWDVVEEVDRVGEPPHTPPPEVAARAWHSRGGGGLSYEIRGNVMGLALPDQSFGLSGFCATGTGSAPASVFGQSATDDTRGIGGGVGGRVGYMHVPRLDPASSSPWWTFRLGAGLDIDVLHARVPTGVPPLDGELCTQVVRTDHEVASESQALPVAHVPIHLGVMLAVGSFRDAMVWRGIVMGAAWSPSYLQAGAPWSSSGNGYFHHLGLELTVDFVTLHAARKRNRPEAHLRIALFLAPAITAGLPSIGSLGIGPVWY